MFAQIKEKPCNIVVVGDFYVSPETIEKAIRASSLSVETIKTCFWGTDNQDEFAARQLNLERHGPEAEAYAEGLDEVIADADILVTHFSPVPKRLIDQGTNLKAIFTCRGGVEHIDVQAASQRNIPVVNVIRNAEPVADFTLGMILALTRNIAISHRGMMDGHWMKTFPNSAYVTPLSSLTVGLAGVGNIGIELARRLKALDVKLLAWDNYISRERLDKNGLSDLVLVSSLEELFSASDVVSLHLRLTEDTLGFIDKRYFSLMKPSAYFINSARGGLVNQADLVQVLEQGRIAGAALDVFDLEPLEQNSPLKNLPNVVLTPHIAGQTVDAIPRAPFLLMKEVERIIKDGITDRIVNYRDLEKDRVL